MLYRSFLSRRALRLVYKVLFDSGATYSIMRKDIAEKLGHIEPLPEPMEFSTVEDGRKLKAEGVVRLEFYIDGVRFSDEFIVMDGITEDVIIGAKTMQAWRFRLDFEKEKVILERKAIELRI